MCGEIGIYGVENSSAYAELALFALQHRGQESAGIAVSDGRRMTHYEGMGLTTEVFRNKKITKLLSGHIANGHTRYSTTGQSKPENIQPLIYPNPESDLEAEIAISHNGNFPNSRVKRDLLENEGTVFHTHTDTELILKYMEKSPKESLEEKLIDAFSSISGSFSAIITTKNKLIAVKDPWGNRPLCMGILNGGYVFASESCALDAIGAEFDRELDAGEMIIVDEHGLKSIKPFKEEKEQVCVFEHVYFARPDSIIKGQSNAETQIACGERLWKESPVEADFVIPILDSGKFGAVGVAKESGLAYLPYIIKNKYVGRTFIIPEQAKRTSSVKVKFNAIKGLLKGKIVVLVEDSIVRATTMQNLVRDYVLGVCGAKEVHLRINSPPYRHPCFYGIDTPTHDQLIAAKKNEEEIRKFIGAASLHYLSLDGLLSSCPGKKESYCTACFNGDYQIALNGLITA